MFSDISILTGLIFSVFYPLCFWIVYDHPIDSSFRQFNLGLISVLGGVSIAVLLRMGGIASFLKHTAVIWLLSLFLVTYFLWKKDRINSFLVSLPSILGVIVVLEFQRRFVDITPDLLWTTVLSGFTFCGAIFSLILGHWYLNVHGLPIRYLIRAVNACWIVFALRFIWDTYRMMTLRMIHGGDLIPIYTFLLRVDGMLLWMVFFFGVILPFILIYFVQGTLRVKSTQSATGILYVLVIAILMGDLTYKYYLIKFGLIF